MTRARRFLGMDFMEEKQPSWQENVQAKHRSWHVLARALTPPCLRCWCTTQVAPPDHPAGTTWVWDDGSGVVLKAEEKAKEELEQRKAEQKEEVRVMNGAGEKGRPSVPAFVCPCLT